MLKIKMDTKERILRKLQGEKTYELKLLQEQVEKLKKEITTLTKIRIIEELED